MEPGKRRRAARGLLLLVAVVLLVFVLPRFGLHWLGAAGAAAWVVVRTVAPLLLRLLTLAPPLRERGDRRSDPASRDPDAAADDPNGPSTRARAGGAMSRAEALQVLGLEEGATREEIVSSYRTLIRKVHPDTPGGSTYLATQLNLAKELLLR
jgi:hypothetical protein